MKSVLFIGFFISMTFGMLLACKNKSEGKHNERFEKIFNDRRVNSKNGMKYFQNNEANVKLATCDYSDYFDKTEFNGTPLKHLELGQLNLPTGQIIACDPLVTFSNSLPFTRTVKPGRYPVIVCIAMTKNSGDRYAVVKLEFAKTKAIRWELAITDGQSTNDLKKGEIFGFGVDAGLGCFIDVKTRKYYNDFDNSFIKQHPGSNIYDDLLDEEFKKNAVDPNNPNDSGDWVNFYLPNKPELNIIMFHSGYGDGLYPSYWGIDEKGEICSLVIDFEVI